MFSIYRMILLTISVATMQCHDSSHLFEEAKASQLRVTNTTDRSLNVAIRSSHVQALEVGQSSVLRTKEGHCWTNDDGSISSTSMRLLNKANTPTYAHLLQEKTVSIKPGDSLTYHVEGLSYVTGIRMLDRSELPSIGWNIVDGVIQARLQDGNASGLSYTRKYVTTPENLERMEKFYQRYFMPDNPNATAAEVWANFLSQGSGVTETKRAEEVVVTLTSYPARFETTWLAIESLLRQKERPDRVNLNLFEDEFPGRVLPWFIREQMKRGLEINWCPVNLKVYLKIVPAVQKFPKAIVVATDDDIIYPQDRLQCLMNGHRLHPKCVVAQEVREISQLGGHIYPMREWNFTGWNGFVDERALGPSKMLVPEGVTGVLIPPGSLHETAFDFSQFKALCPTEDDLWIYSCLVMNGINIFKIPSTTLPHVIFDAHNMDCALSKTNTADGYKVASDYFGNLFTTLGLGQCTGMENYHKESNTVKDVAARHLQYGEFVTPRYFRSPLSLLTGFSWTENWEGHRGGVWTDKKEATFSLTPQSPGLYNVSIKGRFVKDPKHPNIEFSILRDGLPVYSGFFDAKNSDDMGFFNFNFFEIFREAQRGYTLVVDNPIAAAACGFNDPRELGVMLYKVKMDAIMPFSPLQTNPFVSGVRLVPDVCDFLDTSLTLLRDGASKIAFDYAELQYGVGEADLKDRFSRLLQRSYDLGQKRELLDEPSIPLLHHRTWHTSKQKPKEVPDNTLNQYMSSVEVMTAGNPSWQHIFWCNAPELIPETIRKLKERVPQVTVRTVSSLEGFACAKHYNTLMEDSRYTNANDIFRISVINQIGGFYADIGFRFEQDPSPLMNVYDRIFYTYENGAIDHNLLALPKGTPYTEAYLLRFFNAKHISKAFRDKWSREAYFQQHVFCGAACFLIDILLRTKDEDRALLLPEGKNPYTERNRLASWFRGNDFGNKAVEDSKVDFFNLS